METLETKIEKSGLQLDGNQSEERSFDLYVDVTPLYSGPNNPNNGPNNFNPMGGASVCGNNFGNNHALQSPWQIQTQTINASLGQDFLNNSTFSYMGDNSLIGKDNQRESYNPIGSNSNFDVGNRDEFGCINQKYNLGEIIGNDNLNDYGLTERYDLSGHNDTLPHLNQDIVNLNQNDNHGFPSPIINSGHSNKINDQRFQDGYKGLGQAHNIDLFNR